MGPAPILARKAHAPLALTMGDPAGIGPEIALKAWFDRSHRPIPPFAAYADPALLAQRARMLGLAVPIVEITAPGDAAAHFAAALPVRPVLLASPARPGIADSANAPAVIAAIEAAVHDTAKGETRAVVTCPIAKSVLYEAGFAFPGHTEFLAHLAERHFPGHHWHPVMMLASDTLRVVPLTIHVPLKEVPGLLSKPLLYETIRITWDALHHRFGIEAPRIAVAGLNPHAGEDATIGREDAELIAPVIRELQQEGIAVTGPHPADTMFHAAARQKYDAAICMYHDQALIPIKTLAFDEGVNLTLGLPFVRTSPDHGTAFDIAAAGRANPTSLIKALKLADTLSARQPVRS